MVIAVTILKMKIKNEKGFVMASKII